MWCWFWELKKVIRSNKYGDIILGENLTSISDVSFQVEGLHYCNTPNHPLPFNPFPHKRGTFTSPDWWVWKKKVGVCRQASCLSSLCLSLSPIPQPHHEHLKASLRVEKIVSLLVLSFPEISPRKEAFGSPALSVTTSSLLGILVHRYKSHSPPSVLSIINVLYLKK